MTDTLARLRAALSDRYRVERELGAGGMATVYLAHDLRHERDVAIKVLHPDLGAALGADRFLAEIKTLAKLQHPHILALIDSGAADSLLYYVMPYVRGETLRGRLERETQLPIPDAIRIATEVAEALQVAHAAGIVHRDIKPENILLQDGHALVADFGIALAVQQAGGQRMTQTGLSLGTPQYMSPEQAMGERAIDARADIYALGAMTYEMLTGDAPFTGSSVQAIVARVLTERPAPIRSVRDTVSEATEAAVLTALAKLPADRFATATQFAEALVGKGASPSMVTATVARPAPAGRNQSRVMAGITSIAVAVAAYLGFTRTAPAANGGVREPILRVPVAVDSPYVITSLGADVLADGSGIAFVGDGPAGHGVLVRRFADTLYQFLPLSDASVGQLPTPDGTAIVSYVFTKTGHSRAMIVPLNGSPPRAWTDSLRYGLAIDEAGWLWGSHNANNGLMRVSPDGSRAELMARPDSAAGEATYRFPIPLPQGRGVLFTIGFADGRPVEMGLYDSKKRTVRRMGRGRPEAFVDGRYVVYLSEDNTMSARRFDIERMEPQGTAVPVVQRASGIGGGMDLRVSAQGDALYFIRQPGTWSVLRDDGKAYASVAAGSGAAPSGFRMSLDGRYAAIATDGGIEFHARDNSIRRVSLTGQVNIAGFTPDGAGLVFTRGSDQAGYTSGARIEVAPMDGSASPYPLQNGPEPLPTVNSGGATGSFVGVGPTGVVMQNANGVAGKARGIFFLPRGGGAPVSLAERGYGPEPSPDGRFVAWSRPSTDPTVSRVLMVSALPPASGTWEVGPGSDPRWSADSRTLFFSEPRLNYDQRPPAVMKVSVEAGPSFRFGAVSVASRPPANATPRWDVGRADGRVYWLTSTSRTELVFVHHFARLVDSLVTQAGAPGK